MELTCRNKIRIQAFKYYMKAAELGYTPAMNKVAWCYKLAEGVEQKWSMVERWSENQR